MKRRPNIRIAVPALHQRAEDRLRTQRNGQLSGHGDPRSAGDTQRLLHELQVHQVELEIQNEELRKARDEMEAGQEKYSDLYEFAPVGYFTLTVEGTIHQVNLTGASLVGIERARLVGRTFGSLLSAELRPVFNSFLEQVFAGQAKQERDFDFLRSGKSPRIVNLKAQRSASGKDCRVVMVDITEQTQAEAATAKLAAIVKTSNDAIISIDLNGIVTSWNAGAEKIFGYSASEMVGRPITRLIPTDRLREEVQIMRRLRNGEDIDHFETLRVAKDGRLLEMSITVSPIRYASGKIVGASKVARDITDRKRAEEALRESEERLRLSQDVAHVGTFDWDLTTGINIWTPRLEALYGLPPGGFPITQPAWEKLVHSDDRAAAVALVNQTLRSGKTVEGEWRVIWPDGSIHWIAGRFRAFKDKFGKPIRLTGVNIDITERKTMEITQRRAFVLAASNKMLQKEIVRRQVVEKLLKQSEQRLRQLSQNILLVQEGERKRISRDLHDTVMQTLVGIGIHLASLTSKSSDNPMSLRRKIAKTQLLVEKSLVIVHRFAEELRPSVLDDLGLISALHTFMKDFIKRTGVRASLTAYKAVNQLPISQSTVLYRVALEALNNVAVHAQATAVKVEIQKLPDWICLTITDDGKSFDPKRVLNAKTRGRLGLLGMRERLEMVGGRFEILSANGKGTTVIARIPFGKARRG